MDEKQALNFLENVSVCHNCECWYEEPRNHIGGCYRNFTDKKRNCDLFNMAVEVLRKQQYYQWIPFSERKPKHKQLVIIKMGNNKPSFNNTRTAQYNNTDKVFIYNVSKKGGGCIKEEFITEWLPFPEVNNDKN